MTINETRRKDDTMLRKIVVTVVGTLITSIIIEIVVAVFYIGSWSNQIVNNTTAITKLAKVIEKSKDSEYSIVRMQQMVSDMNNNVKILTKSLSMVAAEQNRRTEVINEMRTYLRRTHQ